jgi:hypothetical protein
MKIKGANFLLLVTLATLAATPGLGRDSAAQNSVSIPDFSGMWAHPWLPGYEPLASGPTSLKNRSRRYGGPSGEPGNDFAGEGVSNPLQLVGDYTNPILKPEAAEVVKKFGEMSMDHYGFPNPRNQCWPNGLPFVLSSNGMQMFQHPDSITIIYQQDHQVRRVRMNQPHPAHVAPSWYGDSVGHYEGDTLVIDTVAIKPGPFAMVDWFGTPQTPALHVIERYRLLDYEAAKEGLERASKENALPQPPAVDLNYRGKYLQLLFTVDDPTVFTTPWSATVTFGRPTPLPQNRVGEWLENICGENPRKYGTERDVRLPTADKPDF